MKSGKSSAISKVDYLWAGNLLSEEKRYFADGTEVVVGYHYEQGSFVPIAQEVDGELQYIVTDHLGTPKEVYSEGGELLWSVRHELWGKINRTAHLHAANDNGGYNDCILRFQGQIEDEESGLYYNRFRYYDPESGNYTQADPIGLAGGSRLHGYVSSSTLWIDPLGLHGYETNGRANLNPENSGKWGTFDGDVLNSDFSLNSSGANRTGYPEGTKVPYSNGKVDFSGFATDSFDAKQLTGKALTGSPGGDNKIMTNAYAKRNNMTLDDAAADLRKKNLRLHHAGGDLVEVVPKGIHKVPHTGGAAKRSC